MFLKSIAILTGISFTFYQIRKVQKTRSATPFTALHHAVRAAAFAGLTIVIALY